MYFYMMATNNVQQEQQEIQQYTSMTSATLGMTTITNNNTTNDTNKPTSIGAIKVHKSSKRHQYRDLQYMKASLQKEILMKKIQVLQNQQQKKQQQLQQQFQRENEENQYNENNNGATETMETKLPATTSTSKVATATSNPDVIVSNGRSSNSQKIGGNLGSIQSHTDNADATVACTNLHESDWATPPLLFRKDNYDNVDGGQFSDADEVATYDEHDDGDTSNDGAKVTTERNYKRKQEQMLDENSLLEQEVEDCALTVTKKPKTRNELLLRKKEMERHHAIIHIQNILSKQQRLLIDQHNEINNTSQQMLIHENTIKDVEEQIQTIQSSISSSTNVHIMIIDELIAEHVSLLMEKRQLLHLYTTASSSVSNNPDNTTNNDQYSDNDDNNTNHDSDDESNDDNNNRDREQY